jgi:hypothetical protein
VVAVVLENITELVAVVVEDFTELVVVVVEDITQVVTVGSYRGGSGGGGHYRCGSGGGLVSLRGGAFVVEDIIEWGGVVVEDITELVAEVV